MNTKKYDYVFKVVITGDSQVGKTTLLKKYIDDPSIDKHFGRSNGLSGRPYLIKAVQKGSLNVRLEIHDTMGQERFRSLTRSYYRGAHGCLICFDVNNPESFDSLSKIWIQDVHDFQRNETMAVVKVLVGIVYPRESPSTSDNFVTSDMFVSRDRAEGLASGHEMKYMEVNLNETSNIQSCFSKLVDMMIESRCKHNSPPDDSFNLDDPRTPGSQQTSSNSCRC